MKVPRSITHDRRLRRVGGLIAQFLEETAGLGVKCGVLLVQLPPSLQLDARVAGRFLGLLRERYDGFLVCEPRDPTWLSARADALLVRSNVARVAADPPPAAGAGVPGGWTGLVYYRLHGAPRKYWSHYSSDGIDAVASAIRAVPAAVDTWYVFDDTASGAALENAWELDRRLRPDR